MIATRIKPNLYKDSVALMRIAEKLLAEPGVSRATLVMGTPANKEILEEAGLLAANAAATAPSDLIIVIEANDEAAAEAALGLVDGALSGGSRAGTEGESREIAPKTIHMGRARLAEANLVQVSVPGAYAGAEALKAVKAGLNVFLFSDNVPVEQERALKLLARQKGVLVMGPDCGTAIIGGVPLGFANVVRRGRIGVIGASGTGLQEVTSQIHLMGEGISHAIGTGGRDVKAEVGGITMLSALELLANDSETAVIGIVSKPPAPDVMRAVVEQAGKAGKPVAFVFLGGESITLPANLTQTHSLYECAAACVRAAGTPVPAASFAPPPANKKGKGKYLRGLFSGGTFCTEAQVALKALGIASWSNVPLDKSRTLKDLTRSQEHTMLDLGDDDFTIGKPHPMIDPSTRVARIAQEAADPDTAALLIDIVLGYAGHMDPAGALSQVIMQAKAKRDLPVVAFVCGTEEDPQVRSRQEASLKAAGCIVAPSSTEAARIAAALVA